MLDVQILGVLRVLLTLSLRLLASLLVLLSAVGDALLLPAVGFPLLLPAVGFLFSSLLLAMLFRSFSSFLPCCWVCSFGSRELLTY